MIQESMLLLQGEEMVGGKIQGFIEGRQVYYKVLLFI